MFPSAFLGTLVFDVVLKASLHYFRFSDHLSFSSKLYLFDSAQIYSAFMRPLMTLGEA